MSTAVQCEKDLAEAETNQIEGSTKSLKSTEPTEKKKSAEISGEDPISCPNSDPGLCTSNQEDFSNSIEWIF